VYLEYSKQVTNQLAEIDTPIGIVEDRELVSIVLILGIDNNDWQRVRREEHLLANLRNAAFVSGFCA